MFLFDKDTPTSDLNSLQIFYFILKYCIYLFLESGREGERAGEKQQCVAALCVPPTGDMTLNPGMCPYWELNQ